VRAVSRTVHGSLLSDKQMVQDWVAESYAGMQAARSMYRHARASRRYDGPDEVHKVTVARQVLRGYKPVEVPSEHVPTQRSHAEAKFADLLEQASLNR
jgi:hypothetical protein